MKLVRNLQTVLKICFLILVIFSSMLVSVNAQEPLKIGVISPITGPFSSMGEEAWKGVRVALDVINAKGGIQGRKVEYIFHNTPDVDSAIAATENLINGGVNIIVSSMISSISYAIAPICDRSKVISWHLNASTGALTQQGHEYLFRTSAIGSEEGADMIRFVYDMLPRLNLKPEDVRVAGVFEDGVYGTDIMQAALKTAEELGMTLAFTETYSPKAQDLSSLVMRVKQSNPNVFLMVSYPPDAQLILREAAKIDLAVDFVVGTGSSLGTSWFLETYGADMVDTVFSTNWPIEKTPPGFAPGMEEFVALYKEKFGKERLFTCHSATGYTGMLFLWDVLERTKDLNDVESIRQAVYETDIPISSVGCGWGCKFAPPGDPNMGTNLRAGNVCTQWQDGNLWTVWPVAFPDRDAILPVTSPFFSN